MQESIIRSFCFIWLGKAVYKKQDANTAANNGTGTLYPERKNHFTPVIGVKGAFFIFLAVAGGTDYDRAQGLRIFRGLGILSECLRCSGGWLSKNIFHRRTLGGFLLFYRGAADK